MADPLIEVQDLSRVYHPGALPIVALDRVTTSIARGEMVAIVGPSGSGKSTFMNLLGCLDRPTRGTYQLDRIDVAGLAVNELAALRNRKIGFVFQSFNLLPRATALANVELPMVYAGVRGRTRHDRAERMLADMGLAERVHHRPTELSGGQQQRVAIARALVNDPVLVLADEPTGALDSRTSLDIMAQFQRLNRKGITVVVVTHEPDVAAYASRVLSFRDGHVVSDRAQTAVDAAAKVAASAEIAAGVMQ